MIFDNHWSTAIIFIIDKKTVSTCSEDECEETEADEGDGGLVRVGRILGTFCLECLRSWWWWIISDDNVNMAPVFVMRCSVMMKDINWDGNVLDMYLSVPVFHFFIKSSEICFSPSPSLTKISLNRSVHLDSSDLFLTWISHLQSVCICPLKPSIPLASVRAVFWRNDLKLSCGDLVCPRDVVCEIASIVMEDIFPNTLISGTDGRAYLLHDIGWSGLSERAWFCRPSTFQRFSHSVLVPLPECHTIWANLAAFIGPGSKVCQVTDTQHK